MRLDGHIGWTVLVALAVAGAGLLPGGQPGAVDPPAEADQVPDHDLAIDVVAYECDFTNDGICLGYDGATPAVPIVAREGDLFRVSLTNRIAETLADLDTSQLEPTELDRLETAGVSFHTHGTVLAVDSDGVQAEPGSQMVDSFAGPGQTYVYEFEARYAGAWHFHDHVMGPDGAHGQHRGLYGSLFVLPPGEPSGTVVDLHLLDAGGNGGRGVTQTAVAGEPMHLVVVGLGNEWWTVTLQDPDGATVGEVEVGPGVSLSITVDEATAGEYTWTANSGRGHHDGGQVVVQ